MENKKGNIIYELIRRFFCKYEILESISQQNIIKSYGICYGDSVHPPSILPEYYPVYLSNYVQKLQDDDEKSKEFFKNLFWNVNSKTELFIEI
ncbi:hypothetical protein TRFO_26327 [Tritrichomonas foetus]|uniref:Uncharacterized protein n=1 Tax=Tritrichomonas foetus TaxID=1144522 RepID=A0A1J4K375_9EUKA|nr:hypothetical protein TRFO_26327 [Tritrichomonas foetus]|eukprot:OHT05823.1 hypothetical protein TRFO_26327 [Tritrichomonas foetus]